MVRIIIFFKIILCIITLILQKIFANFKNLNVFFLDLHENTSLKFFHSNHPMRFRYYVIMFLLNNKPLSFFLNRFTTSELNLAKKFIKHNKSVNQLNNKQLIFIGDSHVEFFSRSKSTINNQNFSNCFAIWLGPKTTLGIFYNNNRKFLLQHIKNALKKIIDRKNRDLALIWSTGSIDIRFFIYELYIRKIISSDKEMLKIFDTALDFIILNNLIPIKKEINFLFPEIKISLALSLCSNIQEEGMLPKSKKDIDLIKKKEKFPTFGSLYNRQKWVNDINKLIIRKCKVHKIFVYEHVLKNDFDLSSKFTSDNIHLTDPNQVDIANLSFVTKRKLVK